MLQVASLLLFGAISEDKQERMGIMVSPGPLIKSVWVRICPVPL